MTRKKQKICAKTSVKKLEQLWMTIFAWFWEEYLLKNYEYIIEYITWTAYCIYILDIILVIPHTCGTNLGNYLLYKQISK